MSELVAHLNHKGHNNAIVSGEILIGKKDSIFKKHTIFLIISISKTNLNSICKFGFHDMTEIKMILRGNIKQQLKQKFSLDKCM